MHFSIQKNILQEAVSKVQKAVTGKTTMPILQGIFLQAINGKLILLGSDKDLTIEATVDADIDTEGKIVVDSRLFGDLIRKLPNDIIEISTNQNSTLTIKCLKSNATLVHMLADDYPAIPTIQEEKSITLPQNMLKNMIKSTIFAAAHDETRPIFTGVLFEVKANKINLVAMDGYRVAIRTENIDTNVELNNVIPGKTLSEVSKILEDTEEVTNILFTTNHILFDLGKTKVISRLLEGEFIKYDSIIPKEYLLKTIARKEDLLNSIDRASLIGKEGKTNLVKLDIQEDKMIITSNSQLGMAREEININLQGDDLKIAFNSKYLMDILKIMDSEEVEMEFSTNVNPCIVKNKGKNNCTYLLLPVRMVE